MEKSRALREDSEEAYDHGIIVVVDGLAWGPFDLPEEALGWALKFRPDNLFKLMHLIDPDIVDIEDY